MVEIAEGLSCDRNLAMETVVHSAQKLSLFCKLSELEQRNKSMDDLQYNAYHSVSKSSLACTYLQHKLCLYVLFSVASPNYNTIAPHSQN